MFERNSICICLVLAIYTDLLHSLQYFHEKIESCFQSSSTRASLYCALPIIFLQDCPVKNKQRGSINIITICFDLLALYLAGSMMSFVLVDGHSVIMLSSLYHVYVGAGILQA